MGLMYWGNLVVLNNYYVVRIVVLVCYLLVKVLISVVVFIKGYWIVGCCIS